MKSMGFGAYDGFSSVSKHLGEFGLPPGRPGPSPVKKESSVLVPIIFGSLVASQLVAYVVKQADTRNDFHWRWYDSVLIPSYLVFGISKLFRKT
jgi:hypothetical protein